MPVSSTWPRRAFAGVHHRLVHTRRVEALAGHIAELIPRGHAVLDVGCGDGLIAEQVLERRPDLTVGGVDVMVRPLSRIPVTRFNGRRLPFPDQSWDTVLFCDVLHHVEEPATLLHEAVRVARDGIVIKDHLVQGVLARPLLRFMDFVGNAPHGVALPYNYLAAEEWNALLRECGLVTREMRSRLGLYPPIVDTLFGRGLHFIAGYAIEARRPESGSRND